ncbi:uncharacterized protein LOC111039198 [Myzus persicae]|uniref:uncharacterized protein LOC111039198 n=1 Tax=Myzus persicae TaxID=13164 RepID=UPI000B935434|nr:uncharacterized protein LOC111039198 [Myzus persicae]
MEYVRDLGMKAGSNVVHCPFNNAHTMPQKTLILHLTKCPDKTPNLRICPFNCLHVVEKSKLNAHENQCPDRLDFDQMVYETNTNRIEVTLRGPVMNDLDETWDVPDSNETGPVESVVKSINKNPCFMKPPAGYTKSERKKYRSEAQKAYSNVDLSYNPNLSMNDRLDSTISNGGRNVSQSNQQGKNKGLFFGHRPNT